LPMAPARATVSAFCQAPKAAAPTAGSGAQGIGAPTVRNPFQTG
jgi:hypothetical protein